MSFGAGGEGLSLMLHSIVLMCAIELICVIDRNGQNVQVLLCSGVTANIKDITSCPIQICVITVVVMGTI